MRKRDRERQLEIMEWTVNKTERERERERGRKSPRKDRLFSPQAFSTSICPHSIPCDFHLGTGESEAGWVIHWTALMICLFDKIHTGGDKGCVHFVEWSSRPKPNSQSSHEWMIACVCVCLTQYQGAESRLSIFVECGEWLHLAV